ncbi:uncharacterized protein LOC113522653 isoform X1 [Galleria mellonella]|uniref:Uncharacterized protein LOC113522653 isoform X1 n=1 Tax=Galleria mellonella TaxID=7137 RepID=A0A6J1X8U2_GALME|nr:uncharacterized protein LOC113522653 isoform X1 [Galleria mellonella]
MAATARREIDTGEEDIAAIAKQISDHAEAIYQTWKARGLAPTEILSCRPAPGIKLAESLRTKPKPEPKPEIKQRPDFRREHRPELVREQRPDVKRERSDTRREIRPEPEGETIEVILPPDLVPERNGTGGVGAGGRRTDPAAMRLEVAREEERLLRALRTGGVVAERSAERPDVVPPISLVDYAKSRYQDRLDTGARKPVAGASGERRASLGSHVTEARSKFEARARRASSAGAGETATASASGVTPVRPFLTRGSVAERVLMFERCPSEATLELAKRKSPAATTWRGPHDVINRAQNYAASTPTKPSSAPAHTTLQRTVRGAANSGAPARVIPRFHFPKGRPPPAHQQDHALHKVQSAFATFPNSQVPRESFKHIVKACECPLYWKMPLFLATQQSLHAPVDGHKFIDFWREMTSQCHDQASRFVYILTRGKSNTLAPEDFVPLVQDVVDTHPGLSFLKEATEFHSRYVHTVIARIFYCVNRSWSGRISIAELRRSNLLQVIQLLEDEEDINQVTQYFSYEHFYVIYCKFWELDRDHDLFIDRHDLARHNDHALSSRMIERVLSGCVTRGNQNRLTPDGEPRMSYTEFVWFLLAEEDKTHPTAIEYWFRCMDVDGDGYISMYELEYFYEEQMQRMEAIGIETLPFNDCLCQMLDMVHPAVDGKITLSDLKKCKLTPIFFDTFFNLEKYLDHEQRDPFATQRDSDCEMSEWDRFAAEEYELLVAEEGGSDAQDQISYDETDEDCLSPNLDDITSTEVIEDSSVDESTLSEGTASGGTVRLRDSTPTAPSTTAGGFVNLSSIYSIDSNRWSHQPTTKNGFPEKRPEKPVPPEKPVSLMMVNGKMDNKYAGFGNNSFLYSHLLTGRKDPPSYSAATSGKELFDKEPKNSPVKSPITSPVNGVNKISDNYERAVAERLSPQREISRLNRSSLFSKVNTGVVSSKVKKNSQRNQEEDDDYARDSDECSI